ncbi:hypothetical protein CYMTET_43455 [Cymbomonas tetramitiformis]|uniref:Amino acid transporter transmembrane domain-containing protein n=1 Tax=Cymbomonas tetramitiformis TaxID=36881 RepID=A0AAE0C104_9CHLO|nr:hypothetical protein CYMTET_44958 [Cymbomonas tetramitiformis]KAK3247036.1 hypothetical protein CYMTET_43455 [Cymbomonas tetramitiformis]
MYKASLKEWLRVNSNAVALPTLNTVICTMLGSGILQLPYTLKQGGWMAALIIVVVAVMATYTGKALILCLYRTLRSSTSEPLLEETGQETCRLTSYPAIGYEAFGWIGEVVSQAIHKINQMGVSALFLILAAGFMNEVTGRLGARNWTLICGAMAAAPVLAFPVYREMNWLSLLGVSASVAAIVVVIAVGLQQHFAGEVQDAQYDVIKIKTMPLAFSAIVQSFGGHATFPTIEGDMEHKEKFSATIAAALITLTAAYLPVAFVGYFVYGNEVASPILSSLPQRGFLPILTKIWVAFHVLTAYPILMLDVAIGLQEYARLPSKDEDPRAELMGRVALRSVLVAITIAFAFAVPYFGDVMSLVGATCGTATVFLLPCAFNLKLRWGNLPIWEKLWNVLIFSIGFVGGSIGAYQAFVNLIDNVRSGG